MAAFIEGVTKEFGSREKASTAWVNRGFTLYQQDDLVGAMRRFNSSAMPVRWILPAIGSFQGLFTQTLPRKSSFITTCCPQCQTSRSCRPAMKWRSRFRRKHL